MAAMNSEMERKNRQAAVRWGSVVVGLLSLQVAGGIAAIVLATGDESVAVVPDYHQKALQWDREIALRDASAKLGWQAKMTVIASQRQTGAVIGGLQIMLSDREGQPVSIESGSIEWYRHVRAGEVQRRSVAANEAGLIDLQACFDAEGLWQVSIDLRDEEGNRFVLTRQVDVDWSGWRDRKEST